MKPRFPFRPRSLAFLKPDGPRKDIRLGDEILAGITVGLIALALALGIASLPLGVETPRPAPALGIFTAIIAGVIVSLLGDGHRPAGSDRVPAFGSRRGWLERRPARQQHRTRRPRHREPGLPLLRRAARHRRDRAHLGEHQQRRAHAFGRRHSRDHPAGHRATGLTMGGPHSHGRHVGGPDRRLPAHGRMA